MNTTKMRHALERAETARDAQAHAEWYAAMTPEHRAIHERPFPVVCGVCLQQAAQNMQVVLTRLGNRP